MREKKKIQLANVVVGPDELRALEKYLSECYDRIDQDYQWVARLLRVRTTSGTEFESEDGGLFGHGGVIDSERIAQVDIDIRAYYEGPSIRVKIIHNPNDDIDSEVTVSGSDSTWVNGVVSQIDNIVKSWPAQPSWPRKYEIPLFLVVLAGVTTIIWWAIGLFGELLHYLDVIDEGALPDEGSFRLGDLFFWIGATFGAIMPTDALVKRFQALWPKVEIRTGPNHRQIETRRKAMLILLGSMVVVPILVSWLGEWVASLFSN